MTVTERISALRGLMKERGYDIYIVPTDDFHQSENAGTYFQARAFITGFTGSAGTAVITLDHAGLWTDGRYFLQAENQLSGSPVTLYRMLEPNVPTIFEFLEEHLPENGTIGFDGRVISMNNGNKYQKIAEKKHGHICDSEDLIDLIWEDRPAISTKPAFALDLKYTGASTKEKLVRVREAMKKNHATVHVIASLDDICWITNLRGRDIDYYPLLLSYAIITMDGMKLYVDSKKLTAEMCHNLETAGITILPYNAIYDDLKQLDPKETVLLDPSRINYALRSCIPANTSVVEKENPTVLMKSVKNETELHNIEQAHIKDGIAVTRFMYWLKTHVVKDSPDGPVTELSAAAKLEELRKEQDGYLWQSFGPICASGAHAAIVHYSASEESNVPITENGLFLTDTGGGYLEGSTDITRTLAFGNVPQQMKEDFTSVLLCNLHLANIVFLYGTTGGSLDVIGRIPLWKRGLDFNHGTGHGVGYLMNIHEEPARFRRYLSNNPIQDVALEPGMIITDEPGVYITGSHGIRIENELMVCEGETTACGRFLYFKPITLVPIDLDAIIPEMMTVEDKELLNTYHKRVYEAIAPHLNNDEREWLKEYTRAI